MSNQEHRSRRNVSEIGGNSKRCCTSIHLFSPCPVNFTLEIYNLSPQKRRGLGQLTFLIPTIKGMSMATCQGPYLGLSVTPQWSALVPKCEPMPCIYHSPFMT